MAQKFYTRLTKIGQAKYANAKGVGEQVNMSQLAVGDANGQPLTPDQVQQQEAMINQVRLGPINQAYKDADNPNWLVLEQILPPAVGGWTIREVGIYDDEGDLVAYGNYPETYKPILDEGSSRTSTVRFVLMVSDTSAVTLKVDPSVVLATRQYVDDRDAEHAKSRNHPYATTTLPGMTELATGTEAKARADKKVVLTPETGGLMLAEHEQAEQAHNAEQIGLKSVLAVFGDAAKTVQSVLASLGGASKLDVATQAETDAGAAGRVVTADKLRFGVAYRLGQNGYVALPSWLAGLIIQWGVTNVANPPAGESVNLSIEFPNAFLIPFASYRQAIGGATIDRITASTTIGRSQIGLTGSWSTDMTFHWLAIGY